MEGPKMVAQRLATIVFTIMVLTFAGLLPAEEPKTDRMEAAMDKLKLTDQQKQQCKKICADFDKKADPLIQKLCTQRGDEWQAISKILTDDQRAKLPEIVKASAAKELQILAKKLNLTDEQKTQVGKIREEFWKKYQKLAAQKDDNYCHQYRQLWMEALADVPKIMTVEQRAKLPAILRDEFQEWHDHTLREEHMKAMGDQLGLSAAQRKQISELCTAYEKKSEQPRDQLKQLCKEGCAAMDKVLNADQRAKLHEMFPFKYMEVDKKD
jgi:Spy/CpxP family protein refolding chaperone